MSRIPFPPLPPCCFLLLPSSLSLPKNHHHQHTYIHTNEHTQYTHKIVQGPVLDHARALGFVQSGDRVVVLTGEVQHSGAAKSSGSLLMEVK